MSRLWPTLTMAHMRTDQLLAVEPKTVSLVSNGH